MKTFILRWVFGCLAASSLSLVLVANAQSKYPDRPIQFVVGYAPGGSTDIIARSIADRMAKILGVTIVVLNKPGADSMIAANHVAQSKPDGYTVLITSGGHAANVVIYPDNDFDPVGDFDPISLIGDGDNFLVVNPSLSATSLKDFVSLAKEHPGKYNFGSAASLNELAIRLFNSAADIDTVIVPYKGAGELVPALLSGQIDVSITSIISVLPFVKSGQLTALAVTGMQRSSVTPDVPTVDESGFPGYNGNNWYGALAPAGTPKNIIDVLNAALKQALEDEQLSSKLQAQGLVPRTSTPEEFSELIKSDIKKWSSVSSSIRK